MVKVFIDLDGTLLDSSDRLHRLFADLVPNSALTKEQYWKLKRAKVGHAQILSQFFNYSSEQIQCFETAWLNQIELDSYLQFDKLHDGVLENLQKLSQQNILFLLTSRQSRSGVCQQLQKFSVDQYFQEILVTEQKLEKKELIKSVNFGTNDWVVGDTGHDILTGKQLNMHTAAICNGFMSRELLHSYAPDLIFDSFSYLRLDPI